MVTQKQGLRIIISKGKKSENNHLILILIFIKNNDPILENKYKDKYKYIKTFETWINLKWATIRLKNLKSL